MDVITQPIKNYLGCHTRRLLRLHDIAVYDCVTLVDAAQTSIDLLIDMDALPNLFTCERITLTRHLCAIQTVVGWCVAVVEEITTDRSRSSVLMTVRKDGTDIDLSNLWIGEKLALEEEMASLITLREVEKSIDYKDDRYWIGLLWLRTGKFDSNFASALYRLRRMVDKLHPDETYEQYQDELLQLMRESHAERIPLNSGGKTYYMPHIGVWRENALSTKLRVVFDASSHCRDEDPLNAQLSKGIDLNPSIAALMLRFRVGKVAAIADLRKAFLQIRIHEHDRNFLRFLWIDGDEKLAAYRMSAVPFGVTCSFFLLAVVIRHHLNRFRASFAYHR